MPERFEITDRNDVVDVFMSGTDGIDDVVDVVVQGGLGVWGSVVLVSKQTNYERTDTHE